MQLLCWYVHCYVDRNTFSDLNIIKTADCTEKFYCWPYRPLLSFVAQRKKLLIVTFGNWKSYQRHANIISYYLWQLHLCYQQLMRYRHINTKKSSGPETEPSSTPHLNLQNVDVNQNAAMCLNLNSFCLSICSYLLISNT